MLLGPVNQGLAGDYPDLTTLDRDDSIVATVHVNDYYATLAQKWFGVPSSELISGGAPLTGIIDT